MTRKKTKKSKQIKTILHKEAKRTNIPSVEYQSQVKKEERLIKLAYERRNKDCDPQLVWQGKEEQNLSDLLVDAPPLFIEEKIHPKILIDDLG